MAHVLQSYKTIQVSGNGLVGMSSKYGGDIIIVYASQRKMVDPLVSSCAALWYLIAGIFLVYSFYFRASPNYN